MTTDKPNKNENLKKPTAFIKSKIKQDSCKKKTAIT